MIDVLTALEDGLISIFVSISCAVTKCILSSVQFLQGNSNKSTGPSSFLHIFRKQYICIFESSIGFNYDFFLKPYVVKMSMFLRPAIKYIMLWIIAMCLNLNFNLGYLI